MKFIHRDRRINPQELIDEINKRARARERRRKLASRIAVATGRVIGVFAGVALAAVAVVEVVVELVDVEGETCDCGAKLDASNRSLESKIMPCGSCIARHRARK